MKDLESEIEKCCLELSEEDLESELDADTLLDMKCKMILMG